MGATATPTPPGRAPGRGWHDMGGLPAGAIDPAEHDYELWEKRVDALLVLCGKRELFSVDGLRRALEELGPEAFAELRYYERWMGAIARNLTETGVLTNDEIGRRIAEVEQRGTTYGEVGER